MRQRDLVKKAFSKKHRFLTSTFLCLFVAVFIFGAHGCYTEFTLNDPLMDAAQRGDVDQIRLLIRQGADPNYVSDPPDTPLDMATYNDYPEVVRVLLKAGADPNWEVDGKTALDDVHSAETAKILKAYGARHGSHPNGESH